MRKQNQFTEWFKKVSQIPNAYIYLKSIAPHDILIWHEKTNININNLSLQQAVKLTNNYIQNQKNTKIKKLLHPDNKKYETKEKQLLKKYVNKPCSLNGYPAKIQKTNTNLPIIFNKYTCLTQKAWRDIDRHYPHFAGGKIFQMTDNIQTIEKLIENEQKRPHYPKQEFVLFNLNFRLNTLKGIKPPNNPLGIDPLRDRDIILSMLSLENKK